MTKRSSSRRIVLPVERTDTSRRTFLKSVGFGVAAGTLAACSRAPVRHVVPRIEGTEGLPPGRACWIATTCGGCAAGCGAVARCVEGRPVKLEGNAGHPVSGGGLCATGQAQVLSLYDGHRFALPLIGGSPTAWEDLDARVRNELGAAKGRVRVLTGTLSGRSTLAWIARFAERHGAKHVAYDALPASAIAAAHQATHGVRALPAWRFDRARVIASFGADFLGTWISPVEFAAGWRAGRRPDASPPRMSKHWQAEAAMSLTGSRADRRVGLAPWETAAALAELCDAIGGGPKLAAGEPRAWVREMAADLAAARGESLVVCGEDDLRAQTLAAEANARLGNYGATLDLSAPCRARLGDTEALRGLVADMAAGNVAALVVAGCNPVYDLPADSGFADALARVPFVVAVAPTADETTARAHAVAPRLHALESWDDAEPRAGVVSLTQPAIRPVRNGRTIRECLARWCGDARPDRELVRETYADLVRGDAAWDDCLRRGWFEAPAPAAKPGPRGAPAESMAADPAPAAGSLVVVTCATVGLLDGTHAHNAWLQELPDPVTKCTWDNHASLSPATALRLGVADGDVVRVSADGAPPVELPALVQTGQHDGVVVVALGYGRAGTDRFAKIGPKWIEGKDTVAAGDTVGRSAASWRVLDERGLRGAVRAARVERTGARRDVACTQDHHRLEVPAHLAPRNGEVRDAVRTFAFAALPAAGEAKHGSGGHGSGSVDLWPDDHATPRHRWGMVVDLAACDGCSACVVACQAENNIPCVGRDEVLRHREMQWMRIDRYWTGDGEATVAAHQPMMCQHCENAPCETVCPVLATVHSSEGLNQQVYNRCVGTRYCANNCPYKTRRFNWFDYPREDALQNLALNPGVTVRTRGVMEKCSLCVHRIQEGKAEARVRGVPLADGDVRPACAQSCPAGALVFGDILDPQSEVSRRAAAGRAYQVLAELNVKPGVSYLADVRNRPEGPRHGG